MAVNKISYYLPLVFLVLQSFAQIHPGVPLIVGNPQNRTERYSFSDAILIAQNFDKKIVVVFRAKSNPSDSSFMILLSADERIRNYLRRNFVLVYIDMSFMEYRNQMPPSDLLKAKISKFAADPKYAFFDKNGEMICRYGIVTDPVVLYNVFAYVALNYYQKQSISDYFDDCKRKITNTPSVYWYSYNEGVVIAKTSGKKILLNAHGYWSPYCVKMKHLTYSDPSIISFIEANFVPIQVELDIGYNAFIEYQSQKMTPSQLLKDVLGVKGYPETVFCESDGTKIKNISGYLKSSVFSCVLKYFAEGDYKTVDINTYLKQKGINEAIE